MSDGNHKKKKLRHTYDEKYAEGSFDENEFWFTHEMNHRLVSDLESRNVHRMSISWTDMYLSDMDFYGLLGSENYNFLKNQMEFYQTLNIRRYVHTVNYLGIVPCEATLDELNVYNQLTGHDS
jgi:hypothetical protein